MNAMGLPENIQKFIHALANENRQKIMLLFADQPVLTVGEVATQLTLGMSTTSEHLKQLKEAGLLRSEKLGKEVEYRPNVSEIQKSLNGLCGCLKKCC